MQLKLKKIELTFEEVYLYESYPEPGIYRVATKSFDGKIVFRLLHVYEPTKAVLEINYNAYEDLTGWLGENVVVGEKVRKYIEQSDTFDYGIIKDVCGDYYKIKPVMTKRVAEMWLQTECEIV